MHTRQQTNILLILCTRQTETLTGNRCQGVGERHTETDRPRWIYK